MSRKENVRTSASGDKSNKKSLEVVQAGKKKLELKLLNTGATSEMHTALLTKKNKDKQTSLNLDALNRDFDPKRGSAMAAYGNADSSLNNDLVQQPMIIHGGFEQKYQLFSNPLSTQNKQVRDEVFKQKMQQTMQLLKHPTTSRQDKVASSMTVNRADKSSIVTATLEDTTQKS